MRPLVLLASAAAVVAATSVSVTARADAMDPAIERLVTPRVDPNTAGFQLPAKCTTNGKFLGNVDPSHIVYCNPDDKAFAKLINQYGMAVAPSAMHTARTTGFGSFHLSIEGVFTGINNGADYWKKGTQGPQDTNTKNFSDSNKDPASMLQVYALKIRKGFPFGLEISAQVGYLSQTKIVTGGADVRMSLLEGFRRGPLGILPDVSAGGGVRTISGTPQFNLTVASFDAQISKPLPVGDSNIIAPYVGFQYLWIFGDSGLIDTTPNTDPVGYCNYTGPNTPGNWDAARNKRQDPNDPNSKPFYDGQPVCSRNGVKGSPLDFNNTQVFDNVRVTRQRLIAGITYRYEYVHIGLQFMTDLVAPADAGGRDNKDKLQGEPKQTAFAFDLGAFF